MKVSVGYMSRDDKAHTYSGVSPTYLGARTDVYTVIQVSLGGPTQKEVVKKYNT